MLQDYVEKAFAKDRCAIGRFWGQTYIWIPSTLAKKIDDSKLSTLVKEFFNPEKVDEIIMLPGTASDEIKKHMQGYTRMHEVFSMQEAVKEAKKLSKKGDVVILSPGAASFNLFKNEFDRGRQFVEAVKKLSK